MENWKALIETKKRDKSMATTVNPVTQMSNIWDIEHYKRYYSLD